ncbi:MAG: hypothetical protein K2Q17_17040 [Nitrospiraceae bacterium]|nr:hypothetical protein [Nitrospiraceae bacterium]
MSRTGGKTKVSGTNIAQISAVKKMYRESFLITCPTTHLPEAVADSLLPSTRPKPWTYRNFLRDDAMGGRLLFPKATVLK